MTELNEIAQYVFTEDPKKPHSICLTADTADTADNEYVFELVSNLLLEGLYVLFGNDFDVQHLNDKIFYRLNEYLHSVGFTMKRHYDQAENSFCYLASTVQQTGRRYMFVLHNTEKRDNLGDYTLNIGLFQISFDYLR